MNCPNCNREMKLMCRLDETRLSNGIKSMKVLGRCEDCDLNATWRRDVDSAGEVAEYDLKRYFLG